MATLVWPRGGVFGANSAPRRVRQKFVPFRSCACVGVLNCNCAFAVLWGRCAPAARRLGFRGSNRCSNRFDLCFLSLFPHKEKAKKSHGRFYFCIFEVTIKKSIHVAALCPGRPEPHKGLGPRTPELFMGFWASRAQCGHMDTFFDCRTFYQLVVQK